MLTTCLRAFARPSVVRRSIALLTTTLAVGALATTASAANISAGTPNPGVRVPVSGTYFGGSNTGDNNGLGCSQGESYLRLECKITYAGVNWLGMPRDSVVSQAMNAGEVADGSFHTSSIRTYLPNDWGCKSLNLLKPGGSIYERAVRAERRVNILSTKCGSWAGIANGSQDEYFRQIVDLVDAMPVRTIFVLHHEPEDNACSGGFGTPDDFRKAFRHVAKLVRDREAANGVNKISMGLILMGVTYKENRTSYVFDRVSCSSLHYPSGTTSINKAYEIRNPENWYAGDDAVDWIGADIYSFGTANSFESRMRDFTAWGKCPTTKPANNYGCSSARLAKPYFLGETGVGLGGYTPSLDQKATWFTQMHADLVASINGTRYTHLRKLKAIAYWSSPAENVIDDTTSTSTSATAHPALKAYAKMALDPKIRTPTFG